MEAAFRRRANIDEGCVKERQYPTLKRGCVSGCRALKSIRLEMFHLSSDRMPEMISLGKFPGIFKPRVV